MRCVMLTGTKGRSVMEDGEEETGEEEVTAENESVGAVAVLADTVVDGQFKMLKRCKCAFIKTLLFCKCII